MNEEEQQNGFDALPFDSQMRILRSQRSLMQLAANSEEMFERSRLYNAVLELIETSDDAHLLNLVLFKAAEYFEAQKPLVDGDDFHRERARELDWLRHVAADNKECLPKAVEALRETIMGGFDEAWRIFNSGVNTCKDEFTNIINYWREALA